MILDSRHNNFLFLFPKTFFANEIKEKYKKYYTNLLLPYDTIEDFMTSTIQSIHFPGWSMNELEQTRTYGKKQEYKSSLPIDDYFERKLEVTFKMTDAYINYFIFLDNALNYLDFNNRKQAFDPFRLVLLNSEGYAIASVLFDKPILYKQSDVTLSYASVTPDFNSFKFSFSYFKLDIKMEFE